VPGLDFHLRPRLAGSIDGVVMAGDGSTESVGAGGGG